MGYIIIYKGAFCSSKYDLSWLGAFVANKISQGVLESSVGWLGVKLNVGNLSK